MKRERFTEEQIIGVLKEHEPGAKTADLCRKHGISEATSKRIGALLTCFTPQECANYFANAGYASE